MTKILVVDDDEDILTLLVDVLSDLGFDVVAADGGAAALGHVFRDRLDLALIDIVMPVVDGYEVLRKLRLDPTTQNLPVIILTAVSAPEGEQTAIQLGANHYVTKPWDLEALHSVIRVSLREAEKSGGAYAGDSGFVSTGNRLLDSKLGGGVPLSGLTLIEGGTSTGKSVLCQHFAYAAFNNDLGAAYFTTQYSPKSLISQMGSLGLDASTHYHSGLFRILPLAEIDASTESSEILEALTQQILELPDEFRFVIVDAITSLVNLEDEDEIQSFFAQCKKWGNENRSLILSVDPVGVTEDALYRVRARSDSYLGLHLEKKGSRLSNVLEVIKVRNAEELTGNIVSFMVEPGLGIKIDALRRASS